jgi:hypothetical protein
MPTYNFRHRETGEIIERLFKIADREEFLEQNPHYESVMLGAPALGDPIRLGLRKPDNGFREVLAKAKEAHPLGNVNTF